MKSQYFVRRTSCLSSSTQNTKEVLRLRRALLAASHSPRRTSYPVPSTLDQVLRTQV